MRPAHDDDAGRQNLLDDAGGLGGGIVVHAHHGDAHHVGGAADDLLAELVPAGHGSQIDQVHVEPLGLGGGGEVGQPMAHPARLHALPQGVKAISGNAGV
jgi:hypothetical protein